MREVFKGWELSVCKITKPFSQTMLILSLNLVFYICTLVTDANKAKYFRARGRKEG